MPNAKPPKGPKLPKPLAKVKNPTGRVDVLFAQLIEHGLKRVKHPAVPALYAQVQPLVEAVLKANLGPRTRRGRKIAADLFSLKATLEKLQGRAA